MPEKMAGEKTRQKLRDEGVDPKICEQPNLTYDDAYKALNEHRRKVFLESFGSPPEGALAVFSPEGEIEGAGESFHVEALSEAFEAYSDTDTSAKTWALLEPEPLNPYDSNAVAIKVDSVLIGYIGSEDAEYLQPALLSAMKASQKPLVCPVKIWKGDDDRFSIYLKVSRDEFTACDPVIRTPKQKISVPELQQLAVAAIAAPSQSAKPPILAKEPETAAKEPESVARAQQKPEEPSKPKEPPKPMTRRQKIVMWSVLFVIAWCIIPPFRRAVNWPFEMLFSPLMLAIDYLR